ncbi:UBX domain-containing protein 11, partial [Friedmanniomyces endolithicus]
IKELNDVIYSDPAQIRAEKKKARLVSASELAEKIVVTYYADGLMINRGPFRPTASDSYKSFVQDIMDGYFPSEFRQTFPDGVLFDLRNRENVRFEEEKEGDFMSVSDFLRRLPKTMIKNGDVIDLHKD